MTFLLDGAGKQATPVVPQTRCSLAWAFVTRERAASVRHVVLLLDPRQPRRIHWEIKKRLEQDANMRVSLLRGGARQPLPRSIDLLLDLERLIYRLRGPRLWDRIQPDQPVLEATAADDPPDLTVDLCGPVPMNARGRVIRLTYDGVADCSALFGALIAGRMPAIELEDVRTHVVTARGIPCADNVATISDALEHALARVATLVVAAVRGRATLSPQLHLPPSAPRSDEMLAVEAKSLARIAVKRLYYLCCYSPHWRTCWRLLDGPDLWTTRTLSGTSWNVLPDPGFRFYADPFPFIHDGKTWIFVEDFDHRRGKAVISVVPFDERGPRGLAQPVLEEGWHLSYPFIFAHAGQIWMIPESSANRTIDLYRAERFPHRWARAATLVADIEASDATLVRHHGHFWMFAATRDGAGSWSDTLSLYYASDLRGPWRPHPANPVLIDPASARPAGAIVVRHGKLWRPVQDCTQGYGTGIGLAEIITLDHERFEQKVHTVLRADRRWPGRRLHTLNRAGRIECIDGAAYSPRSRPVASWLETWSGRREAPKHWPVST